MAAASVDLPAEARPRRSWIAVVALYAAAVAYHSLQSLGHRTPAVFTDELANPAYEANDGDVFDFVTRWTAARSDTRDS